MSEIIFSKVNYNRKKEFRIITKILKDGNKFIVRKLAENPDSINHIQSIKKKYELLSQHKNIELIPIQTEGEDYIDFEFVHGDTLDQLFEKALINKDFGQLTKILQTMNSIIDGMNIINANVYSKELFSTVFDPENKLKDVMIRKCIYPANLDSNLDNVLIDKNGKYKIFDYEWVFDFPIEVNFIKFRYVFSLATRFQELIKQYVDEDFVAIKLHDNILVPVEWLKQINLSIEKNADDIQRYIAFEVGFFNYAYYIKKSLDQNKKDSIIKTKEINNLETFFQNNLATRNELNSAYKSIDTVNKEIGYLNYVFNAFKSSRSWLIFRIFYKLENTIKKALKR